MKKLLLIVTGLFSMAFIACNSPSEKSEAEEGELTPVTPADQHRYNINSSTEEVINLDTTQTDSTRLEEKP